MNASLLTCKLNTYISIFTSDEGEKGNDDTGIHRGADELEVQRRDICAQHASQAQQ